MLSSLEAPSLSQAAQIGKKYLNRSNQLLRQVDPGDVVREALALLHQQQQPAADKAPARKPRRSGK